ncbi:hypothetical protein N836_05335 [Leptolyngbya sp. Heron Island J]|uniref:hypothetical protein n=1 Tax=Leptolyngbya sp. Heron Island J TaxID=1385935 RepID=UPI0003B93FF0|nr:hypothetical protein [Leptolyngbya sp. Heron Island J]ESA36986.1 hypothetical protein N836_05335 [Leptolyngbya sp. Heron Island J]
MAAKSIRKSVSFDDSDGDRVLLDAIATHQANHQQSFSDLCKQALHQYLLSREPTPSVMLFMELQHQIAQLGVRIAALEDNTSISSAFHQADGPLSEISPTDPGAMTTSEPAAATANDAPQPVDDPILTRLGPLLDDF